MTFELSAVGKEVFVGKYFSVLDSGNSAKSAFIEMSSEGKIFSSPPKRLARR